MDGDAERRLAALSRRQHGVFARRQAVALGVSADVVDGRIRSGRYERLLRGVAGDPMAPDSWERRAVAAVLWAGDAAVLARASAARALRLVDATDEIEVLVTARRLTAPAGITVHTTRALPPHHRTTVGALPTTAVARTICEFAAGHTTQELRDVVTRALRRRLVTADLLARVHGELGRIRGSVALREVLAQVSPLDADCSSELETAWLRFGRRYDLVPTAMNLRVVDATGRRRRFDAAYVPERLPIELDGRDTHTTSLDALDDLLRESSLLGVDGWRRPLRFTWGDLHERPDAVARVVRTALTTARSQVPTNRDHPGSATSRPGDPP